MGNTHVKTHADVFEKPKNEKKRKLMRIIQTFTRIKIQLRKLRSPAEMREAVNIDSEADCDDLLDVLCGFWEEVSVPVYFREVVEYQNAVLRFQVRLQKSSHIRMIHQNSRDGRLLLDDPVLLNYRFSPESYDYLKEMEIVKNCFRKVPIDFYKRSDMEIIPVIIYDNNKVLVDRNKLSSIEEVPDGLIEINELLQ